jgi:hypothetical protein
MQVSRRSFVAGALAAGVVVGSTAAPAREATGTRRFELFRDGSRIGQQSVTVARSGAQVTVEVDIDIAVRIVGVPVYRYTLSSSEVWDGGRLTRLDAVTDNNGSREFVAAARGSNGLAVKGSGYSGVVDGNPGTTTYWSPAFLKRPVWISTQDGRPLAVTARSGGVERFPTPAGELSATRWQIGGDLTDLDLFYDRAGEWIGSEFRVEGDTIRIETLDAGAELAPLWIDAA